MGGENGTENEALSPFTLGYPTALKKRELELCKVRRRSVGLGSEEPTVGFALSGGGIRSATFCLGIFQALADKHLLDRIDYLSSVSGGGFFASFYGRLFTRQDISGFTDAERILSPDQQDRTIVDRKGGKQELNWKSGIFRWLRENGRYLAPSGSGDLLTGITLFLRNWLTVQLIVAISALSVFLLAQFFRGSLPPIYQDGAAIWWSPYLYVAAFIALFIVTPLGWSYWTFALPPLGEANPQPSGVDNLGPLKKFGIRTLELFWGRTKPALILKFVLQGAIVMAAFAAVLLPFAYVATHRFDGTSTARAYFFLIAATLFWWQFALLRAMPAPKRKSAILFSTTIAFAFLAAVLRHSTAGLLLSAFAAVAGLGWFLWVTVPTEHLEAINRSEKARTLLTQWLRMAVFVALGVLAFAAIDSLGQTSYLYTNTHERSLSRLAAWLFGAATTVAPFARSLVSYFSPGGKNARISLPLRLVAGIGAAIVILPYLVLLNALSHAIAYDFRAPRDASKPNANVSAKAFPESSCGPGAAKLETPSFGQIRDRVKERFSRTKSLTVNGVFFLGHELRIFPSDPPRALSESFARIRKWVSEGASCGYRSRRTVGGVLLVAAFFSIIIGFGPRTSSMFLNRTSLHALYCARLVRAYLGASNKDRYGDSASVSDPVDGDDIPQQQYWYDGSWWTKGAPLHLVNVTINETLDGRSQTEQRDRKGVGMAIGPAGFSLGVQHHVVFTQKTRQRDGEFKPVDIYPKEDRFSVFYSREKPDSFAGTPLSLGNWAAISGAAVSTGLGAIGSIGTSLLTGFFNVRLGYWWDSGTKSITPMSPGPLRTAARATTTAASWHPSRRIGTWFTWAFPVQSSLIDEFLGRFHGTLRRYWNLTDGGHFENLAGYELIRRRLPFMVIIDAGADPEYEFTDLANLIRKARLDFNAEIKFVTPDDGTDPRSEFGSALACAQQHFARPNLRIIGTIDQLRRGKWASEPVPERNPFFKSVNTSRLSLRHAALAKVTYLDDPSKHSYLLLLKPTLIGEEPQDLINYHSAHPDFPQESTVEQFFNEAQWESYRRLGQHIGERLFA